MKIGAIFLVSILALAGMGVGFAAWTDTIYIEGTVNTGSVEWAFVDYSGTWVYKDVVQETCIESDVELDLASYPDYILVACSYAEQYQEDDHHAVVVFDNLFPCINFEADVVIEYQGTVPGKINNFGFTDADGAYWPEAGDEELIDQYTTLTITITDEAGNEYVLQDLGELYGYQLHLGYKIHIVMTIHLPQDNTLMNLNGDFSVWAEVVQWNEYPYPQ